MPSFLLGTRVSFICIYVFVFPLTSWIERQSGYRWIYRLGVLGGDYCRSTAVGSLFTKVRIYKIV